MLSALQSDLELLQARVDADSDAGLTETLSESWSANHREAHTTVREAAANAGWWLLALARTERRPSRSAYRNAANRFLTAAEQSADDTDPANVASVYIAALSEVDESGSSSEEQVYGILAELGTLDAVGESQEGQSLLDDAWEWMTSSASEVRGYVLDTPSADLSPDVTFMDKAISWAKDNPGKVAASVAAGVATAGAVIYLANQDDL